MHGASKIKYTERRLDKNTMYVYVQYMYNFTAVFFLHNMCSKNADNNRKNVYKM